MAAPPTAVAAVFLVHVLTGLHKGGVKYVGQKGHSQKILSYVKKVGEEDFTQSQMEELCQNLLGLEAYTQARRICQTGRRKFRNAPLFPYYEAMSYILGKNRRVHNYRLVPLLQEAQRLARAQPSNEDRDRMLEDIDNHLREMNPFGNEFMERLFETMTGMPGNPFDDNDDLW